MLFNSYIFVLVFLPCALILYYLFNHFNKDNLSKATLIAMSLWFYAYFHPGYILVILTSVVVNFFISGLMRRKEEKARLILTIGIIINVAIIFYFKYMDFTIENLNFLIKTNIPLMHILMPLGISFFTFQQIGYLVDCYNGLIEERSFIDYTLFVTFFPQLIAGPIVSYNEMVPQFKDRERKTWNWDNFATGLFWFAAGLAKKVLIADNLGRGSDWGYANVSILTGPEAIITMAIYMFRLYFDFSGYCDMACGIAKMFGIDLPINFLSPLKAMNVMEFWNKWHITLGRFLTGYLFNPMVTASNRKYLSDKSMDKEKKKKRKNNIGNICLFLTFFISGIWHGANWTFILWGVIQGTGRVLYQIFRKRYDKLRAGVKWTINFVFNVFSMGVFGAASLSDFGIMLKKIPFGWSKGISFAYYSNFNLPDLLEIEEHLPGIRYIIDNWSWVNMLGFLTMAVGISLFTKNIYETENKQTAVTAIGSVLLTVLSILSLSKVTTFLYFNF